MRAAPALVLLGLLASLIAALLTGDTVTGIDTFLNGALGPYRARELLVAFAWLTQLGAGPAITVAVAVASVFLWAAGRRRDLAALWIVWLGAAATTWSAKYLISRGRPDFLDVASASSPSFPSGHTIMAMAVYGFLAYVLTRPLARRRDRIAVLASTALLILSIGFSRIFLSVHFASDVIAGLLAGGVWLLVGIAVAERGARDGQPLL